MSLEVVFYQTGSGNEPVREWLRGLSKADKRTIGSDIKTVQYGWPIGMPVVRKLDTGLWEIRSRLDQRISRDSVHGGRRYDGSASIFDFHSIEVLYYLERNFYIRKTLKSNIKRLNAQKNDFFGITIMAGKSG